MLDGLMYPALPCKGDAGTQEPFPKKAARRRAGFINARMIGQHDHIRIQGVQLGF